MVRACLSAAAVLMCSTFAMAATCPNPPVPTAVATRVPEDVCIPAGFTDLTIDFFDDYSWRAFVALTSARGFERFHPLWEVFHEDGSEPGSEPAYNACS